MEASALCDDPVWDWDLSWNSERPRLSGCFRGLVTSLVPCSLLWLTTALDALLSRCRETRHRCPGPFPRTPLALCKQAMTGTLIACTLSEGVRRLALPPSRVEYLSVGLRLGTYVLALLQQRGGRRGGTLSSAKLALFWTLSVPCLFLGTPLYDLVVQDSIPDPWLLVLGSASFALVCGEAALSQFTDPPYDALFAEPETDEHLADHQAPLSRLLFSWMGRLMRRGRHRLLRPEDLDALRPDVRTGYVCERFTDSWNAEVARRGGGRPSLLRALVRVLWPWMLVAVCLDLACDLASLAPPIVLDWLIGFVEDPAEPRWHGPVYALLLFGAALLTNLLTVHNLDFLIRASIVPRAGLFAAIHRKVFRLSPASRRAHTLGELCNLLTVDVQRIFQLTWSANLVWSVPLRVVLTLALLWRYLGPACLAGVALLLLVTPLTALLALRTNRVQKTQMEWKDSRLRLLSEILDGIQVLKLFAWEPAFVGRVSEVRERETRSLRTLGLLNGAVAFLWLLTPFLVALCSFVTFVLSDESNVLDPTAAFVSLTLFGRLRIAVSSVPEVLTEVVQSRVSLRRVTDFLVREEQPSEEEEEDGPLPEPAPGLVLELEGACFSWDTAGPVFLRALDLRLVRGTLVAVVGRVGAGKSALVAALLRQMSLVRGRHARRKDLRVAYVSQSAWIQNASFRQNVLFVSPVDEGRYESVVRACCLEPDLRTLPGGDHAEIGEKGVTLSGGQRQRVSLARAVYHDADLYLLDDPLSAVDARVAADLFDHVIGPEEGSLLAHKTRLLVTHDPSVLPRCDAVLLMSGGRIVESGRYEDLMRIEDGRLRRLVERFADRRKEEEEETPAEHLTGEERAGVAEDPRPRSTRLVEAERVQVGRVRAAVYCSYFRSAGLASVCAVFGAFAAHQAFEIGSNVWLSGWSADPPRDLRLRNFRMTVYGLFGLAQGACLLVGSVLLALAATRASVRLHRSMLWSVVRSPLAFFETTPLGRILNRFGKDIEGVDVAIPNGLSSVVTLLASLAGTVVVICANHPVFLLVCLPIGLLYVYMQLFYMATSRQLRRMLSTTLSPVLSFFSECVRGATTVRAFGGREWFTRRQHDLLDTQCRVFVAQTRVNRWLGVRLQLMGAFVVLAVALLSVFRSYGAALAGLTLTYALNVTELLGRMVRLIAQLETRMVSAERVDEYSRLPHREAPWTTEGPRPASDWPSEGRVVFRGYKMRYGPDSELALRGIDLEIPGGQKVGVVGRTGAGKSSLAHALFRTVEPCEGRLFVDGVDVAALGLHDLRSRLTIVPQEPVLFGGDLRLNLDPEGGRHTDARLAEALRTAGIRDKGLDTRIEEGGADLSLGERQQVCLARALLRRSRVLVLDEATAAVDPETDRGLREAVRAHFGDCTVVTVAHRLHTVLDCDRILVMDEGRIVEDGPPDELIARKQSRFRELAAAAGLL